MNVFLTLVEPLRYRAVQRWLERHHVLLPTSRQFMLPEGSFAPRTRRTGRPNTAAPVLPVTSDDVDVDELHPGLMRILRAPSAFRGRAMRDDELLASCHGLRDLKAGDIVVVPHIPERMALSVHRVAEPGLVAGSSETSALPLGIALQHSWGLDGRFKSTQPHGQALWRGVPLPTGPLTPAPQLVAAVEQIIATEPPDRSWPAGTTLGGHDTSERAVVWGGAQAPITTPNNTPHVPDKR